MTSSEIIALLGAIPGYPVKTFFKNPVVIILKPKGTLPYDVICLGIEAYEKGNGSGLVLINYNLMSGQTGYSINWNQLDNEAKNKIQEQLLSSK